MNMPTEVVASVRSEYGRYRRLVELALEQISDADLHHRTSSDANSIAILLRHLNGNLRSRFTDFLRSDGEKPWRRRDDEFEPPTANRTALLEDWKTAWQCVDGALTEVASDGPDALRRSVTIRRQPLTVLDALLRSLAHVAYHTGQIVQLARARAGANWRSLSIPRGGSAAYASNPTREKGPDGDGAARR